MKQERECQKHLLSFDHIKINAFITLKTYLLTFCCLFFSSQYSTISNATIEINNPNTTIQNNYSKDTTQFNSIIEYATKHLYTAPDSSLGLAKRALELAKINNWEKRVGDANHVIGMAYFIKGDFKSAMKNHKINLRLKQKHKDHYGIASALANVGLVYYEQGNLIESINFFTQSIAIATPHDYLDITSKGYINRGLAYDNQGNLPQALEEYFRAVKINEALLAKYKKNKHTKSLKETQNAQAAVLMNIGNIYTNLGEYKKALGHYKKSLEILKSVENKNLRAKQYGNIGLVYSNMGRDTMALEYYLKSLRMNEEIGNKSDAASQLNNIGIIYDIRGEYEKALSYYFRALELDEKGGKINSIAGDLGNIGAVYSAMGQFSKGKEYLLQTLQMSLEMGDREMIMQSYQYLSQIYDSLQMLHEGLLSYKLYVVYRDSIYSDLNLQRLSKLEIQFEHEKEKIRKEQIEQEEKARFLEAASRRDNLQYSGIFLFLFFMVIGFFLLNRKFKRHGNRQQLKRKKQIAVGILFVTFLIFFEFFLVLLDPYVDEFTNQEPMYKLLVNSLLATFIFPLHLLLERKIKSKYELTNSIRKDAPKKTIFPNTFMLIFGVCIVSMLHSGFIITLSSTTPTKLEWSQHAQYREIVEIEKAIASGNNDKVFMQKKYGRLAVLFEELNKYKKATKAYKMHIVYGDSIKSEANIREMARAEAQFELKKAELERKRIADEKTKRELGRKARQDNIQYSVIFMLLLALFAITSSLGYVKGSPRLAEGFMFFSFLIFFEFLLVLADPFIENWAGGAPGIKLLFNAILAGLIFPIHSFFEKKMRYKLLRGNRAG